MLRAGLTLAAVIGLAAPALAGPPSPDPKSLEIPDAELSKARELVNKLGSETFNEREDAERDLAAMGRAARAALLAGATTDPDAEIRLRCRELLPKATSIEMKARLETFLADTAGRYEHDLPGWNKLRAVVRGEWALFGWTFTARPGDKAARELFVEFLNAPNGRKLLTALGSGTSDLGPAVANLKQEMYNAKYARKGGSERNPTAMEVAAVLFVDSQVAFRGGGRNVYFANVMSTCGLTQAVQGSDAKAVALRAVLVAWFDSRTDPYEMYSALNYATATQNNDAAGRLAVRILGTAGTPASYRGNALATLVRLQSRDHLPAIEKLIGDETVVARVNMIVDGKAVLTTILVGDMALAAAVITTGQKLEDYGIEDRLKGSSGSISFTRYGLPEEKRKVAVIKYGWYKLKEGLKGPG